MKFKTLTMAAMMAAAVLAGGAAQAQQALKVGSTPTGSPFTFLDTKTNTIQGVMVDITNAIAKDAGFKATIEPMQFSALIGSLTSKRIDLISAAMFITPTRKEVVDFSEPIYAYGDGMVVPKTDEKAYKGYADMKGMTVGVQVGTAFVEPMQKSGIFKEVKLYESTPDIMRDVNAGRLQAGFLDFPIAAYAINQGSYPNLKMVRSYQPAVTSSVGIATRKDDKALLAKVNASLAKLKSSGELDKILKKWGLD
ncbi:amino acid-binding periplasmic protein [Bordetella ansorpii]|uniref:Amino acid-binding periplasmic protein n=1 Tax=Bordetella ansorpii TaxID=288768 RepID=A0A157RHA1_9BORD|nr:ABC transporter substrate-binding protein [Bordetella ansorpii]SAI57315.1 amino acid-binding periplasmic protein [Bordetella ansorpii]